jgi:hypothetical protein
MVIIGGLLMWVAAKIARVEKSTFGRAMAAAVAASFVEIFVAFLFNFVAAFVAIAPAAMIMASSLLMSRGI